MKDGVDLAEPTGGEPQQEVVLVEVIRDSAVDDIGELAPVGEIVDDDDVVSRRDD